MKNPLKVASNPIVLIILGFIIFVLTEQYWEFGIIIAVIGVLKLLVPKSLISKKY